ncbi:MAG: T9SS type A sorting domain-containing protein [Chitinophagales bacterium]|nr:T9SS type A sorting domain-containing protein [Chitinophagales bacterium]
MQKAKYYITTFLLAIAFTINAQVPTGPEIAWQRCYGGSSQDWFSDAIKTSDNGYLATITSLSSDVDITGDIPYGAWVIKFNAVFDIEWQKVYHSDTCDYGFNKLLQLSNGNYLLIGGAGGEDCPGYQGGDGDYLLAEIDIYGNILWQQLHGSPGDNSISKAIQTQDGGFLCTASSRSSGGDIPFHYGDSFTTDAILLKTDSIGNLIWLKVFGGSDYDSFLGDPTEISRGIYMLSIGTVSEDYDLAGSPIEGAKRWIVKIDSTGEIINENFISPNIDVSNGDGQTNVIKYNYTTTGRGWAGSSLYTTFPEHLGEEGAVAFFDTTSLELVDLRQWGGTGYDQLVKHTRDETGNFYFLGFSTSNDGDLPGNYNNGEAADYWLMATDSNFNLLWSRNFGGSDNCGDLGCSSFSGNLIYNNNMLYAFVKNTTDVIPDHDIECGHPSGALNSGVTDAWLVAFDLTTVNIEDTTPDSEMFQIYPNPSQNTLYIVSEFQPINNLSIGIITMEGQVIFQYTSYYSSLISLDIQNIISGLYLINIYNENNILLHSSKLIINKP